MRAATKRLVSFVVSLLLLFGSFFLYASFLKPAYQEVNALRGELASKDEVIDRQREIIAEVKSLLAQYESIQGLQETIARALPSLEEYPTLVNQLQGLGQVSGLLIESMNVTVSAAQPVTGTGGQVAPSVRSIQLNLELFGPYSAFKKFLEMAETNSRIMDVRSISVSPEATASQNYNYSVVVNAYFQTL